MSGLAQIPEPANAGAIVAGPDPAPRSHLLLPWAVILILGAVDLIWYTRKGWTFEGWTSVAVTLAILLAIGFFYGLTDRNQRLADAGHYAALWIAFSVAGSIFTYLTATWTMPLCDASLARFDALLGFDWLAWHAFVFSHRALEIVLEAAYESFLPQIILSILYLAHTSRTDRNSELLWTGIISLIITALIAGCAPALSAFAPGGAPASTAVLIALRAGSVSHFAFNHIEGIIAIPSFHAAVAILLIYAHRPPLKSFYPMLALNVLMIVSTPSQGNHYLVDVLAGIVVAVL
ncbi:MAG: phosphatase PAP2 family protein, partial [Candidatus Binataceae bacterium]